MATKKMAPIRTATTGPPTAPTGNGVPMEETVVADTALDAMLVPPAVVAVTLNV